MSLDTGWCGSRGNTSLFQSNTYSDQISRFITKHCVDSFPNLGNGMYQRAFFGKIDIYPVKKQANKMLSDAWNQHIQYHKIFRIFWYKYKLNSFFPLFPLSDPKKYFWHIKKLIFSKNMPPTVKKTRSVLSKFKSLNFIRLFGKYWWGKLPELFFLKSKAPFFPVGSRKDKGFCLCHYMTHMERKSFFQEGYVTEWLSCLFLQEGKQTWDTKKICGTWKTGKIFFKWNINLLVGILKLSLGLSKVSILFLKKYNRKAS